MRHAQDATTHGNLETITTFLRIAQIASRPIGTNQEPRNREKRRGEDETPEMLRTIL